MPLGAGDAIVYSGYAWSYEARGRSSIQCCILLLVIVFCGEESLSCQKVRRVVDRHADGSGRGGYDRLGESIFRGHSAAEFGAG